MNESIEQSVEKGAGEPTVVEEKNGLCKCSGFQGNNTARGMGLTAAGRGAFVMSNIFMLSSLLYLASEEVGCLDEDGKAADECDKKVYGFQPSSVVTNIAVISGIVSAFLNPVVGAVVDFTDYRHAMGVISSCALIAIQAAQIYTVGSTWFPMAILQAIAGSIFQIMVTSTYAYFPEMSDEVGERAMSNIAPKITMSQFISQELFLILIIGISIGIGSKDDDVLTAQVSQGVNVPILIVCWSLGWYKFLPKAKAKRALPEGKSLYSAGCDQIFRTARRINTDYKRSIRWYMLALSFAEAGANSFTVCAVIFLNGVVKMGGSDIAALFLIVLTFTVPGSVLSEWVVARTDYRTAWRLNMAYFSAATIVGVFVLRGEGDRILTFVMGCFWGIAIGWFYPTENGFFGVLVPQEQATEMAGIYIFCSVILTWLPPLIFTVMNENGISLNYGLLHLVAYFAIAIALLSMMPSWDVILAESHGGGGGDEETRKRTAGSDEEEEEVLMETEHPPSQLEDAEVRP